MIGAICGDIIGAPYERYHIKTTEFPLFSPFSKYTDDTVLTVATMDALLHRSDFACTYRKWYVAYPYAGYGGVFRKWCNNESSKPYNSCGNGSAMRVSPVAMWYEELEEALEGAKRSAEVTHNHIEGIKGAQATTMAIFLARSSVDKPEPKKQIEERIGYNLDETVDSIRTWYHFDVSCQGTVPQAITCFLESESYEETIRKTASLGGDRDTLACIAGGIAEAYYGVPDKHHQGGILIAPRGY